MTIIKRGDKGSALTYEEMDENIRDLYEDTDIDRVLTNGNTTTKSLTVGDLTAGDLTVNNVTVTNYRPGEIIETIVSNCRGETVTVLSGTYTMENVTDRQLGTTTYTQVTGSKINYTPPPGTKKVLYRFDYKFDVTENSGISHHVLRIDNVEIEPSTTTIASNYASTNWHHANFMIPFTYIIDCAAASNNAAEGQFTSWTASKELKIMYREYSGSYESSLHSNSWWDGSSATGSNIFRAPTLTIQAIA